MSTEALVVTAVGLSSVHVVAGMLVAGRVAERSGVRALGFKVLVVVLWPIVVTGIQILWLLGMSDWHLR